MKVLFILLVILLLTIKSSIGQDLDGLDPSFANNGIYYGDTGVYGLISVQSDGKIIVTGRGKTKWDV